MTDYEIVKNAQRLAIKDLLEVLQLQYEAYQKTLTMVEKKAQLFDKDQTSKEPTDLELLIAKHHKVRAIMIYKRRTNEDLAKAKEVFDLLGF